MSQTPANQPNTYVTSEKESTLDERIFPPHLEDKLRDFLTHPEKLEMWKKTEDYAQLARDAESEAKKKYGGGGGFQVPDDLRYKSDPDDGEQVFKEFVAALPSAEPNYNAGGFADGHMPPIHQPWAKDDFRFWLNLEQPYDKKVMNTNWFNERVYKDKEWGNKLARYLPDKYRVSEYMENMSYRSKFYKNFPKEMLSAQIDSETKNIRKMGYPPMMIREHQDALDA